MFTNSKKYPKHYGIAVQDKHELFLMAEINRSSNGDIYVNFNEYSNDHKPHKTYHSSGELHYKIVKKKKMNVFTEHKQRPDNNFQGTESVITTSIRKGDGKAFSNHCDENEYTETMKIEDDNLPNDITGYQLRVELVDSLSKP